jgi:hypothetical protein
MKHLSDQRAPRKSKPVVTSDVSPEDVANMIMQELYEAYVTEAKVIITIRADNTIRPARLDIDVETTHMAEGLS